MARPNKVGLDYFSMDTDFFEDQKIKKVTLQIWCRWNSNLSENLKCWLQRIRLLLACG